MAPSDDEVDEIVIHKDGVRLDEVHMAQLRQLLHLLGEKAVEIASKQRCACDSSSQDLPRCGSCS